MIYIYSNQHYRIIIITSTYIMHDIVSICMNLVVSNDIRITANCISTHQNVISSDDIGPRKGTGTG